MSTCPHCQMLKSYLAEKGIAYENHDVGEDKAAYDLMKKMAPGIRTVPVIVLDDGAKILTGFERAELDAALTAR